MMMEVPGREQGGGRVRLVIPHEVNPVSATWLLCFFGLGGLCMHDLPNFHEKPKLFLQWRILVGKKTMFYLNFELTCRGLLLEPTTDPAARKILLRVSSLAEFQGMLLKGLAHSPATYRNGTVKG
jgi:hypothetical protein